ncbi:MAG: hypothetical protein C4518_12385 [Desulfobacteraceae bacterium]|nr:MAG: hypothetical protein C4518_12385 [Desulfobacteraceae bacterium]
MNHSFLYHCSLNLKSKTFAGKFKTPSLVEKYFIYHTYEDQYNQAPSTSKKNIYDFLRSI